MSDAAWPYSAGRSRVEKNSAAGARRHDARIRAKIEDARGKAASCEGVRSSADQPAEKGGKRRPSFGQAPRHRIEIAAIDVAPAPGFAPLERGDHRVPGCVEMLERMHVFRILAASYVTAGEANPQLVPRRADR